MLPMLPMLPAGNRLHSFCDASLRAPNPTMMIVPGEPAAAAAIAVIVLSAALACGPDQAMAVPFIIFNTCPSGNSAGGCPVLWAQRVTQPCHRTQTMTISNTTLRRRGGGRPVCVLCIFVPLKYVTLEHSLQTRWRTPGLWTPSLSRGRPTCGSIRAPLW